MEPKLNIAKTTKTPEINGDMESWQLSIKGVSLPQDAKDFYFPIRSWVLEFSNYENESLDITVDLDYFNTSTSIVLLDFFKQFLHVSKKKSVGITWIYEEDDYEMEEVGKDYKGMIGDIITLEMRPI